VRKSQVSRIKDLLLAALSVTSTRQSKRSPLGSFCRASCGAKACGAQPRNMPSEEPRKKLACKLEKSKRRLHFLPVQGGIRECEFGLVLGNFFFAGLFAGHFAGLSPASFGPARSPAKKTNRLIRRLLVFGTAPRGDGSETKNDKNKKSFWYQTQGPANGPNNSSWYGRLRVQKLTLSVLCCAHSPGQSFHG